MKTLTFILTALLTSLALWAFAAGWTSSGPNCPGMDPAWIGWCQ